MNESLTNNVIEQLKAAVTPQLRDSLANSLHESPASLSKALDGIFPTLLSGILNKANGPAGSGNLGDLMNAFKNLPMAGDLLKNPELALPSITDSRSPLAQKSGDLLSMLFGDKAQSMINFIAQFAGIKSSSVSSLLSVALPLIANFLSKKQQDSGLNLAGLASYLGQQKSSIVASAPTGMHNLLGLASIDRLGANLSDAACTRDSSCAPGMGGKKCCSPWKWLLGLIILLLAAFFLWRSCSPEVAKPVAQTATDVKEKVVATANKAADATANAASATTQAVTNAASNTGEAVANAANATTQAVANAASSTSEAAKNLWANLGAFFKTSLPNGIELNIPELGVEKKLLAFIGDAGKPVDPALWFSFDRLLFETGSANLQADSQEQLKNIAEIMKAYPNLKIRLGGYTDNTGDAQNNLKLSQARAESVKGQLVAMGVAAERVEAVGYGQEHPVASNDTEEGRAKNRRIDINITQK